MTKKVMTLIFSILILLVIIFLLGKIRADQKFKKEVALLFAQSSDISSKKFSYEQLERLPEPVQKYFKHVMKNGQHYISFVRLKHGGRFKTGIGKDWVGIKGEQYFTTQNPGFIWRGKVSIATAYDMYLSDNGRLQVVLLNLFKVVDAHGESFDQGELLRWLG